MLRAMIEDEAWPSAQAFTSWAKSVTVSPSIFRSMVTVEPHSSRHARWRGVGVGQPPDPRDRARKLDNPAIVDLVEHRKIGRFAGLSGFVEFCPAIHYIGAAVGGIEVPATFEPAIGVDDGRRYQANKSGPASRIRPCPRRAGAGRKSAVARGGGSGGARADRLYRRRSVARRSCRHAKARRRGAGRALSAATAKFPPMRSPAPLARPRPTTISC